LQKPVRCSHLVRLPSAGLLPGSQEKPR
jgi:hypothetical protein